MYLTCWMDSKPVHILSTFKPKKLPKLRKGRDGRGEYVEIALESPDNVFVYNGAMGGTDLIDQLSSYFRTTHRSVKWHHRVINHFCQVSAINAYILHRAANGGANTHLGYMTNLIKQWAGITAEDEALSDAQDESDDEWEDMQDEADQNPSVRAPRRSRATLVITGKKRKARAGNFEDRCRGIHVPCMVNHGGANGDARRRCRVCSKKTHFKCATCDTFVCIGYGASSTCFRALHEKKKFWLTSHT